eukprot:3522071-Prymnesium_polylepis.3
MLYRERSLSQSRALCSRLSFWHFAAMRASSAAPARLSLIAPASPPRPKSAAWMPSPASHIATAPQHRQDRAAAGQRSPCRSDSRALPAERRGFSARPSSAHPSRRQESTPRERRSTLPGQGRPAVARP